MSAPETYISIARQPDWGSSLLVAVAPHVAFVILACTLESGASFAVLLATFNIVSCLVIGAIVSRAVVFVGASMCLATMGWLLVGFDMAHPRAGTGEQTKSQAWDAQPSPNPQP